MLETLVGFQGKSLHHNCVESTADMGIEITWGTQSIEFCVGQSHGVRCGASEQEIKQSTEAVDISDFIFLSVQCLGGPEARWLGSIGGLGKGMAHRSGYPRYHECWLSAIIMRTHDYSIRVQFTNDNLTLMQTLYCQGKTSNPGDCDLFLRETDATL